MEADRREVYRIEIEVLAEPRQMEALQRAIAETLCQGPDDHDGPCRIAWSMAHFGGPDIGVNGSGMSRKAALAIREELEPIEVWPVGAVDASLGLDGRNEDPPG